MDGSAGSGSQTSPWGRPWSASDPTSSPTGDEAALEGLPIGAWLLGRWLAASRLAGRLLSELWLPPAPHALSHSGLTGASCPGESRCDIDSAMT